MKTRSPSRYFLQCLALLLGLAASAAAVRAQTSYTLTELGSLPGFTRSVATGVNAAGQAIGFATTEDFDRFAAFRYDNGVLTDLGTLPGGVETIAAGINASGQVVGAAFLADGDLRAFRYSGGVMTSLGTLGGTSSLANAINAGGVIVGESTGAASRTFRAFLFRDGRMTDLGTLGGSYARALGLNDAGQIVGEAETGTGPSGRGEGHAFLYADNRMTDLGTLGGYESWANAINASGVVVGASHLVRRIPFGPTHAFRHAAGVMSDLGTLPGFDSSEAYAINAAGQIVGTCSNYDSDDPDSSRGFRYADGRMLDLSTLLNGAPGWTVVQARAINDEGLIAATGLSPRGELRAILLTPSSRPPDPVRPNISRAPASQDVAAGTPALFTVAATGTALTYQWLKDGLPIAGATGASYTVPATSSASMGFYSVVVSSGAESLNAGAAVLTLVTPREITFSTFAGSGTRGRIDGAARTAEFSYPTGIAVDGRGSVFVADTLNHTIRKVSASGVVTTFAGVAGSRGSIDGPPGTARLWSPSSLAFDPAGNLIVSDSSSMIRKVTPDGAVTTLARNFNYPHGVAVDAAGNIFFADTNNNVVRRITPQGTVSIFAGAVGSRALIDGVGSAARFVTPDGLALDPRGNLIVSDSSNQTIRRISPEGVVTTLAGAEDLRGSADGRGTAARFNFPQGVAVDRDGNIFVADLGNHAIRKITPDGTVSTLAGAAGQSRTSDGPASAARFVTPSAIAIDSDGNLFVADAGANLVRKGVPPPVSRLVNVSTRGFVAAGGTLTPGFTLRGNGTKQLLVRGIGPTLGRFGVAGALADARLELAPLGSATPLLSNSGWSVTGNPAASRAAAAVGAFALEPDTRDAAALASLPSEGVKSYTVRIAANTAANSGIALAEVYDADPLGAAVKLVNVSTLGLVGTGANALVPGFVIGGAAAKTLLIRAVGPGLAAFGAADTLPDPQLAVVPLGHSFTVATNDNWSASADMNSAFAQAGAFALTPGSKDAALVVRLPPGGYTVQITGGGSSTGTALVEIYDLDP